MQEWEQKTVRFLKREGRKIFLDLEHFFDRDRDDPAYALQVLKADPAAGAVQVQGTINGWGERCGNTSLCVIIPNILLKMGLKPAVAEELSRLTTLYRIGTGKANIIPG